MLSRKSLPRRRAYKYLPVLRMVSVVYDQYDLKFLLFPFDSFLSVNDYSLP